MAIKLLTLSQLRLTKAIPRPIVPILQKATQPSWLAIGASRPRYFDGRFLASRDLDRDQQYYLNRQMEHFRAAGSGVLNGLLATRGDTSTLLVTPGVAFAPSGALVALQDAAKIPNHDQPLALPLFEQGDTQRLDEAFGLLTTPRDVPRRRTGIYVLLARPVQFTGDPVGLYPANLDQRRTPEDGDTIEAVAFTLAPYHASATDVDPAQQRSALARHLFIDPPDSGIPSDAVPLAIVRLDGGFVTWCDSWLVRREVGALHTGIGTYVRAPRAVAEAQVQQYHAQLDDILATRANATPPVTSPFAASDVFQALPPVGRFPIASLALAQSTESFFPAAMPVSLAVVPEDEIGALLEEQIALPPIDLSAADEDLATTPVAIVLAVPRGIVETLPAELRKFDLRSSAVSPGRIAVRSAVALQQLALRFIPLPINNSGSQLAGTAGFSITAAYFVRLRRATGAIDGTAVDVTKVLTVKGADVLPPIKKVQIETKLVDTKAVLAIEGPRPVLPTPVKIAAETSNPTT
jgi:hypothetical protein